VCFDLSETFLVLRRIELDVISVLVYSFQVPIILVRF